MAGFVHSAILPRGPHVWICGDCHLGNLGPVADAKGRVKIAIRDLDQTVIGNPAHDLIRLGLSLATAIRGSDLPGVIQPAMFSILPFTRPPIILRSFEIFRIRMRRGGARKPFISAVQNNARTGLIPAKLISIPSNVERVSVPVPFPCR